MLSTIKNSAVKRYIYESYCQKLVTILDVIFLEVCINFSQEPTMKNHSINIIFLAFTYIDTSYNSLMKDLVDLRTNIDDPSSLLIYVY